MKPPIMVASDLDQTLIYSAMSAKAPIDSACCVEIYRDKPWSYVTYLALEKLQLVAREAIFVPTTTRSVEQYSRITFPGITSEWAVVANGGTILRNGEVDQAWADHVATIMGKLPLQVQEVSEHLQRILHPEWVLSHRIVEDFFAYSVVERQQIPATVIEELSVWLKASSWRLSIQGRKIYCVPEVITKSAAIKHLLAHTGAQTLIGAGDSLLDRDLLDICDYAVRPGHGELAAVNWRNDKLTVLQEEGIAAGSKICDWLAERVIAAPVGL